MVIQYPDADQRKARLETITTSITVLNDQKEALMRNLKWLEHERVILIGMDDLESEQNV